MQQNKVTIKCMKHQSIVTYWESALQHVHLHVHLQNYTNLYKNYSSKNS